MNNSRIWLVVHPTVGIPVFLGAVAVGSFAVHVAVLSNTTWVADFLAGRELGSTATAALEAPVDPTSTVALEGAPAPAPSVTAVTHTGVADSQTVLVTLPDGRTVSAVLDMSTATTNH